MTLKNLSSTPPAPPPIHGLHEGLTFHVTPLLINKFSVLVSFRYFHNICVIVSPDCFYFFSSCHEPLIKARGKLSLLKSPSKSKCSAHVFKQKKKKKKNSIITFEPSLCFSCTFRMFNNQGSKVYSHVAESWFVKSYSIIW